MKKKAETLDAAAISKRLRALMKARGWERPEDIVLNSHGLIKYGAVTTWLAATRAPQARSIHDLSTAFGITTDEFLRGISVPTRLQAELNVIREASR